MPPPRLQCLNGMRASLSKTPSLKSGISTSSSLRADEPPRNPVSSLSARINASRPPPSRPTSSFNLPVGPRRSMDYSETPVNMHANGNSKYTDRMVKLVTSSIAKRERNQRDENKRMAADPASGGSTSAKEDMAREASALALGKQISRRFTPGDVYAPHDLHWVEQRKWRQKGRPKYDAFDALDLNPLDHYRNFSMVSEYMTSMGRIKHSKETGLRPVNQRRIARTIRRSISMGLMPSVHRHPELLIRVAQRAQSRSGLS